MLHFLGHQRLGKNKENTKSETNARRSASFSFNAPHLDWVLLQALSFTDLKKIQENDAYPMGHIEQGDCCFLCRKYFCKSRSVKFCNSYSINW